MVSILSLPLINDYDTHVLSQSQKLKLDQLSVVQHYCGVMAYMENCIQISGK